MEILHIVLWIQGLLLFGLLIWIFLYSHRDQGLR